MNKIDHNELFGHLSEFFKSKGIELHEGAYTQGIQKGCELLADPVHLSQQAMERAKLEMDRHLEQMRQIIHQHTAPKSPPSQPQSGPSPAQGKTSQAKPGGKKSARAKSKPSQPKGRK